MLLFDVTLYARARYETEGAGARTQDLRLKRPLQQILNHCSTDTNEPQAPKHVDQPVYGHGTSDDLTAGVAAWANLPEAVCPPGCGRH